MLELLINRGYKMIDEGETDSVRVFIDGGEYSLYINYTEIYFAINHRGSDILIEMDEFKEKLNGASQINFERV